MSIEVSPSRISNTLVDKDAFLSGLLDKVVASKSEGWLQDVRSSAADWVRQSRLPTTRDEEWRFADLSALREVQFNNNVETFLPNITPFLLPERNNNSLVFVNGVYAPELSAVSGLPDGVVVSNLANLPGGYDERVRQYLAQASGDREVFTALNTAGMTDAAVVWVGKNVVVETPISLVFVADGEGRISLPRCLVVAESGSQVTLVEEYTNRPSGSPVPHRDGNRQDGGWTHREAENAEEERVYFNNAVTEVWVEENAQVSHTRIESDGAEAFHIGKTAVMQARCSRYSCNAVSLGGRFSRHNLEIFQTGEQTETTLNGLTMIKGKQLGDTHSAIALNHPHSVSRQLHKCIVGDRAHAVFNGKVFVPKLAQLTDATQLNRNLLLSSKARVDTKPQLEITADNVKCAHGATVSQLEDDEIFYLQSRGINANDARNLLINAFAAEIINQIPIPSLRETLTQTVSKF
ncbi:Fe-S cluster assembly protein SufD [Scytonema hofmannii FACHB-248]|uniref:Fe-S cluster assembly protein SufD n=1 Tax=Scytonema hofmannii FACHB-248 TaxID=1842502 RepID=A0ABR8GWZ7_9CYAN|nr:MULTISPECIES: Fe-S cluster assembly protein SufD [Nostocales]MBD2607580.1 Fe-S cluster assembly protein SufD [Scytonema hofmannii FACHB-248]